MPTVLHLLSQRPSLTGSGITLDALVRNAADGGWNQHVVVGVPSAEVGPEVGGLPSDRIHPLRFETEELRFPVPGMSDVMPYPSTRFSSMDDLMIDRYLNAWRRHLSGVLDILQPDLVHSHHLWLMSSILKDVTSELPVFAQCHATGFRQMELCPHLADRVRAGCRRIDRFGVLHQAHAKQLADTLSVPEQRVHMVGAGYREDLFHARGRQRQNPPRLLYVGKYSSAKGLPWLLDAVQRLGEDGLSFELHVVGTGSGTEADELATRMDSMAPLVVRHGQLSQAALAKLMRRSAVCVLPSFYEGLPLVIVEAFACGCRVVSTALPGVVEQLAAPLGDALDVVELPAMLGIDAPVESEVPAFSARLATAIERALGAPPLGDPAITRPDSLAALTWGAVFRRVEAIWKTLLIGS
jgi:glycosyltransferase involved in cell wall biosynthesis